MLKHNGTFRLYPHLVKITKDGKTIEKYALPHKKYFESLENKGFTIEFEEITLTQEQLARYEQIKRIKADEGLRNDFINYIVDNKLPDEVEDEDGNVKNIKGHPLEVLKKDKRINELEGLLADVTEEVMLSE